MHFGLIHLKCRAINTAEIEKTQPTHAQMPGRSKAKQLIRAIAADGELRRARAQQIQRTAGNRIGQPALQRNGAGERWKIKQHIIQRYAVAVGVQHRLPQTAGAAVIGVVDEKRLRFDRANIAVIAIAGGGNARNIKRAQSSRIGATAPSLVQSRATGERHMRRNQAAVISQRA